MSDLGTPEGLVPATSEHEVIHTCLSCGEVGAHWEAPHLDGDVLVEGRFICEVSNA